MILKIWVLSSCIPETMEPAFPSVFATEDAARREFDRIMREEWEHMEPWVDGKPIAYPSTPEEANNLISRYCGDSAWGQWELTPHNVEVSEFELRVANAGEVT